MYQPSNNSIKFQHKTLLSNGGDLTTPQQKESQNVKEGNKNPLAVQLIQQMLSNQRIDIDQIKQLVESSHKKKGVLVTRTDSNEKQQTDGKQSTQECKAFSESSDRTSSVQVLKKVKRVAFNENLIMNGGEERALNDNKNLKQKREQAASQIIIEDSLFNKNADDVSEDSHSWRDCEVATSQQFSRKIKKEDSQYQSRIPTIQSVNEEQIKEEMQKWEEKYNTHQIAGDFENRVNNMTMNVGGLETQFEICFNLSAKMAKRQEDLNQLLKGVKVFKVSSSNKSKAHLRDLFYAPWMESFCWKAPKDVFPEKSQIVQLKDIKEVKTGIDGGRKLPSGFANEQYFKIVLFEKKSQELEFICQEVKNRNVLVGAIQLLVENVRKSRQVNDLVEIGIMDAYEQEVQKIKDSIEDSKEVFNKQVGMLRNASLQATQVLIEREKKKRKQSELKLYHLEEEKLLSQAEEKESKVDKKKYEEMIQENIEIKEEFIELQNHFEEVLKQLAKLQGEESEIEQMQLDCQAKLKSLNFEDIDIRIQEQNNQIEELHNLNESQALEIKELTFSKDKLAKEIEAVVARMGEKESEFIIVVDGLQQTKDELLDKIEELQADLNSKKKESDQNNKNIQNAITIKCLHLEKRLCQKEEVVKELITKLDEQQEANHSLTQQNQHLSKQVLNLQDENLKLSTRLKSFLNVENIKSNKSSFTEESKDEMKRCKINFDKENIIPNVLNNSKKQQQQGQNFYQQYSRAISDSFNQSNTITTSKEAPKKSPLGYQMLRRHSSVREMNAKKEQEEEEREEI